MSSIRLAIVSLALLLAGAAAGLLAGAAAGFLAGAAAARGPGDAALIEALRAGGHVLYFRHAATDWTNPDRVAGPGDWTSCDPAAMRQLSEAGRETARGVGKALRALDIPVGRVLSSEYCRAAETARLLGLGPVETTRDIMNMRAAEHMGGRDAVVRRARRVLATPPPPGENVVVVGHGNLMRAATGAYAAEGGSGVYAVGPGHAHGFDLVAELAPADWARLAARFGARRAAPKRHAGPARPGRARQRHVRRGRPNARKDAYARAPETRKDARAGAPGPRKGTRAGAPGPVTGRHFAARVRAIHSRGEALRAWT